MPTADVDADFVLTGDLRALPELQNLVAAEVAISPIVLKALVNRGVLDSEAARNRASKSQSPLTCLELRPTVAHCSCSTDGRCIDQE